MLAVDARRECHFECHSIRNSRQQRRTGASRRKQTRAPKILAPGRVSRETLDSIDIRDNESETPCLPANSFYTPPILRTPIDSSVSAPIGTGEMN
jgi:hypothetical protein